MKLAGNLHAYQLLSAMLNHADKMFIKLLN